jgi:DNA-binding transcriptional regulator YiaG
MSSTDDLIARAKLRRAIDDGRAVRIRKRAGVTQPALADALGVDLASVWRWEQGRHMPRDTAVAVKWLQLLDEMEAVMGPEEGEPESTAVGTRGP